MAPARTRLILALICLFVACLTLPRGWSGDAPQPPSPVQSAYDDLASSDAAKAYRAIWVLVGSPKESIGLLQTHLKPAATPDPKTLARLIGDLDSDTFTVRDKATHKLERLAELAGPALAKAYIAGVTLEMKQRLEKLLTRLEQPVATQEQLRQFRAVEALELLGTKDALQLLRQLASGAEEAKLTVRARISGTGGQPLAGGGG